MNQIKGSGCEHMKFLTFGTSLHKMKHPSDQIYNQGVPSKYGIQALELGP